ncbi:MAG: NAD-dependent protein deacylase [Gemmatimonadaceae bacterium]
MVLESARALLLAARRIAVLTGAGVSAESGVPTFRGAGGLWKGFRAEDLATPGAFARDPRAVWEWYAWRRTLIDACRPNAAHEALARLALDRAGAVTIITQNVDGLHGAAAHAAATERAAESMSAMPLELHGSIFELRCTRCDWVAEHRSSIDASSDATLPRCARCGARARPGVVWFGESLDERRLAAAREACATADVALVVGTSGVVHPAAGLALVAALAGGAVIEVNPDETPLSHAAAVVIRASAAATLPALLA